ncbi:domain of unknown function DUF1731 [Pseudopedobacter saltans DSM 12145]|uniref:TIGR01777 family protein n=1 Tax=Pseudopedobacter saltans (strain ATCC 51119 / DSM 12145 / JCM 21818 / CCUG 39354 / LMG 10337 / NBRC 100064 / NCIMB 13643) TaxID=762903 RepID=F0S4R4_PSESL|nr:TIGR01777 family oxidoreductase [Pseudopedobacter saltans]ADY53082.1 domain of unknown function DUF1731 [Pseudopedobacter saltans DSM 12145]
MIKKILITGGSGFLGTHLTKELLERGYRVNHLSRGERRQILGVTTYFWNIETGEIDERCLEGVEIIIHLAGAGIGDKRWTDKRKQEIIKSRVDSINLIYHLMDKINHQVETVISASASGYYSDRGDEMMEEPALPKNDFLGNCCHLWEKAVDRGKDFDLRIVKLRTGIILDKEKGAFPKLVVPFKLGVGAPLGNGRQWMSWIHIKDAVGVYMHFIENDLGGVYNMSSPEPHRNKAFSSLLSKKLHKFLWVPAVPGIVLKIALGEMSTILLGSTKMSVAKLLATGYRFKYPTLNMALDNLLDKKV